MIVDCAAAADAALMPSCRRRRQAGRRQSADAAVATAAALPPPPPPRFRQRSAAALEDAVARLCLDGDIFIVTTIRQAAVWVCGRSGRAERSRGVLPKFWIDEWLRTELRTFFAPSLPLDNLRRNMQKKNFRRRKSPKSPKFFLCV